MKIQNQKDRILGIASVLISLWIVMQTMALQVVEKRGDPGSRLFPLIGAAIMLICGLALIIKPGKESKQFLTKEQWKSAGIIFGVYCLCVILFWLVGFMIAVPVVLFIITLLFQGQSRPDDPMKKRVIRSLIYAVIAGAAIYVIYVIGLQADLPTGLLFG
ncbi:MAG: tripartite tricarboxylate transporter TctB family protein [Lachnospiraceae bacterium]|nr:tripartite tricarboxylate transporter TctB family protein [Lachnospiraceae bacterium]MBR5337967.1 tripartite tricarboxylate transporter TctB family protein [Lachnospiraceae bacterium]